MSRRQADTHSLIDLVPILGSAVFVGVLSFAVIAIVLPDSKESTAPEKASHQTSQPSALEAQDHRTAQPITPRTKAGAVTPPEGEGLPPYEQNAAIAALAPAEERAQACANGQVRRVRVVVTFDPDGSVFEAKAIEPVDSSVEACVVEAFRQARIPPYQGRRAAVVRTVTFDGAE